MTNWKLLLVSFMISVVSIAGKSYSQELNLDLNSVRLVEAIREIEAVSGYKFIYSEETVDLNRRVSISAARDNIDQVLEELFEGSSNSYELVNEQIIVSTTSNQKGQNQNQAQQTRLVVGRVTDARKEAIPGVNVILKGTNQGVVTDVDGMFEIRVRMGQKEVLQFSFIGMQPQEIEVGNESMFNITMQSQDQVIDDVVVVGAYGKRQNQMDMVGSAYQVSSKDIEVLPAGRVDLLLDGLVPGLTIEPNTDAPASTRSRYNTRVRGEASLAASNEPLWIVDGTPIYTGNNTNMVVGMSLSVSPLSYINPEDIESITVLKDASETSIYGANGANGVILVTTKQGREGSKTFGFQLVTVCRASTNLLALRCWMLSNIWIWPEKPTTMRVLIPPTFPFKTMR